MSSKNSPTKVFLKCLKYVFKKLIDIVGVHCMKLFETASEKFVSIFFQFRDFHRMFEEYHVLFIGYHLVYDMLQKFYSINEIYLTAILNYNETILHRNFFDGQPHF